MARNRKRHVPHEPEPQRPALCCVRCRTDAALFINSVAPPSPAFHDRVAVYYICTRCGHSDCYWADEDQFTGSVRIIEGLHDVVLFSGHYIHCGQSLQETASGVLRLDPRVLGEEDGKSMPVYLDIRVMECPCGFRLVLPDQGPEETAARRHTT